MQMGQRANTIEELWEQAEEALEASSKRAEVLLTQLVSAAEEGSDASLFAHRHLAELRLEHNPWKAALHLRRVLVAVVGHAPLQLMAGAISDDDVDDRRPLDVQSDPTSSSAGSTRSSASGAQS